MNILAIANLGGWTRDFYCGSLAKSWEEQGHTVIRIKHTEVSDAWARSLQYSPMSIDFMFHSYNSIPLTAVDEMGAAGIPTVLWIYDEPYEFRKSSGEAPHYSISLNATYRPNIKDHRALGSNMYFLPQGVDTSVYHPVELTAQDHDVYGSDVSFIGTLDSRRADRVGLVKLLREFDCKFWGPGNSQWVGPAECNRIYSASRILISPAAASSLNPEDESQNDVLGEYTCRVYNTAAAGAFQLVERKEETFNPYIDGEEIVTYGNLEELGGMIESYLTRDTDREEIARASYLRTIRDHTMYNRAHSIVEYIKLYKDGKLSTLQDARGCPRMDTEGVGGIGGHTEYREALGG